MTGPRLTPTMLLQVVVAVVAVDVVVGSSTCPAPPYPSDCLPSPLQFGWSALPSREINFTQTTQLENLVLTMDENFQPVYSVGISYISSEISSTFRNGSALFVSAQKDVVSFYGISRWSLFETRPRQYSLMEDSIAVDGNTWTWCFNATDTTVSMDGQTPFGAVSLTLNDCSGLSDGDNCNGVVLTETLADEFSWSVALLDEGEIVACSFLGKCNPNPEVRVTVQHNVSQNSYTLQRDVHVGSYHVLSVNWRFSSYNASVTLCQPSNPSPCNTKVFSTVDNCTTCVLSATEVSMFYDKMELSVSTARTCRCFLCMLHSLHQRVHGKNFKWTARIHGSTSDGLKTFRDFSSWNIAYEPSVYDGAAPGGYDVTETRCQDSCNKPVQSSVPCTQITCQCNASSKNVTSERFVLDGRVGSGVDRFDIHTTLTSNRIAGNAQTLDMNMDTVLDFTASSVYVIENTPAGLLDWSVIGASNSGYTPANLAIPSVCLQWDKSFIGDRGDFSSKAAVDTTRKDVSHMSASLLSSTSSIDNTLAADIQLCGKVLMNCSKDDSGLTVLECEPVFMVTPTATTTTPTTLTTTNSSAGAGQTESSTGVVVGVTVTVILIVVVVVLASVMILRRKHLACFRTPASGNMKPTSARKYDNAGFSDNDNPRTNRLERADSTYYSVIQDSELAPNARSVTPTPPPRPDLIRLRQQAGGNERTANGGGPDHATPESKAQNPESAAAGDPYYLSVVADHYEKLGPVSPSVNDGQQSDAHSYTTLVHTHSPDGADHYANSEANHTDNPESNYSSANTEANHSAANTEADYSSANTEANYSAANTEANYSAANTDANYSVANSDANYSAANSDANHIDNPGDAAIPADHSRTMEGQQ